MPHSFLFLKLTFERNRNALGRSNKTKTKYSESFYKKTTISQVNE